MGRRMQSDLQKAARAINSTLGSIGIGVGFGAIVSFGKSILDLGGKITDLATQANLSTDAFQTFANAGRSLELPASRSPTRSTSWLNLFRMLPRVKDRGRCIRQAPPLRAAGLKALRPKSNSR